MKKFWIGLLSVLLLLSLPITVLAVDEPGCQITVESAAALPGTSVTIPVRISGNPGFTNFAITVEYDNEALKLESIDTVGTAEEPHLCPAAAGVNTAYETDEENGTRAFINAASAEPVDGDGVLFTLTFTVLSLTSETLDLEPKIQYLRCGDALTSLFAALAASADKGAVNVAVKGDVDADNSITDADAESIYSYINEAGTLTEQEFLAADVNEDGVVDTTDAALIYRVVHNTLTDFPKCITEEADQ